MKRDEEPLGSKTERMYCEDEFDRGILGSA